MTLISSGGVERIRTSAPVTQPNDLANRPLQPLEYHSVMAERVGFEPTHPFEPTGFQDRTLQPLEYLSITNSISIAFHKDICQGILILFAGLAAEKVMGRCFAGRGIFLLAKFG